MSPSSWKEHLQLLPPRGLLRSPQLCDKSPPTLSGPKPPFLHPRGFCGWQFRHGTARRLLSQVSGVSLAGGHSMARGWNHREAAFSHVWGPMPAVSCDLRYPWPLHGSFRVAGLLRCQLGSGPKRECPSEPGRSCLPVLTQPDNQAASLPLCSAGYEQAADPPRPKGRRKRPYRSMEECRGLTVDQQRLGGPSLEKQSTPRPAHTVVSA